MAKKRYCTCISKANGKSTVNCGYKSAADRPNYSISLQGWKTLGSSFSYKCNQRKRRAIDDSILLPNNDDFSNYIYDPAPFDVTIPSWPTKSGKTKNSVTVYCAKAVKDSEPGKVCGVIPTFNFSSFIDQCIEDVKVNIEIYLLRILEILRLLPVHTAPFPDKTDIFQKVFTLVLKSAPDYLSLNTRLASLVVVSVFKFLRF